MTKLTKNQIELLESLSFKHIHTPNVAYKKESING